jgi:hypothetical protein
VHFTILFRLPTRKTSKYEFMNSIDVVSIMEWRTGLTTAKKMLDYYILWNSLHDTHII